MINVFLHDVRPGGMRPDRQIRRQRQKENGGEAKQEQRADREAAHHDHICQYPAIYPKALTYLKRMNDPVKKRLKEKPESLACWPGVENARLPRQTYISVQPCFAQKSVMQHVIMAKT